LALGVTVTFLKTVEGAGGSRLIGGARKQVEVVRGFWAASDGQTVVEKANGSSKKRD